MLINVGLSNTACDNMKSVSTETKLLENLIDTKSTEREVLV